MTIEIHEPELEALIAERMKSGAFKSVEDVLLHALKSTPSLVPEREAASSRARRTGADLIAVLQRCPDKGLEFGLPRQ